MKMKNLTAFNRYNPLSKTLNSKIFLLFIEISRLFIKKTNIFKSLHHNLLKKLEEINVVLIKIQVN